MIRRIMQFLRRLGAATSGRDVSRPGEYFFRVCRREAKKSVTTYVINARNRDEARARLWMYWCGIDVARPITDRHVQSVTHEVPVKEFSILDTDILPPKETHYLASIINGNTPEPLQVPEIESILREILADQRMGQWFPGDLQPK